MPALILKTEWKSTPDSDGLWVEINLDIMTAKIVPIYIEDRHDSGLATAWGEEHIGHPELMYAKLAEFPNDDRKRFKGKRE